MRATSVQAAEKGLHVTINDRQAHNVFRRHPLGARSGEPPDCRYRSEASPAARRPQHHDLLFGVTDGSPGRTDSSVQDRYLNGTALAACHEPTRLRLRDVLASICHASPGPSHRRCTDGRLTHNEPKTETRHGDCQGVGGIRFALLPAVTKISRTDATRHRRSQPSAPGAAAMQKATISRRGT